MPKDGIIYLDETLLIGRGTNKDVYIHPEDPSRCIRINAHSADDHVREMNYRKLCERRRLEPSALLAGYYGAVETNLGEGYVFERIVDYDGSTSKTLGELIREELKARNGAEAGTAVTDPVKKVPRAVDVLYKLRELILRENLVVHDMGANNCMVQFDAPASWRVRVVDGIGIPTLIPVVYYAGFLRRSHIQREWERFIRRIMKKHEGLFEGEEGRKLLAVR